MKALAWLLLLPGLALAQGYLPPTPSSTATSLAAPGDGYILGNFGLGTASPGQKFHLVDGNFLFDAFGETAMIYKRGTTIAGRANPIFACGRITSDGSVPKWRCLYSDDAHSEAEVLSLNALGTLTLPFGGLGSSVADGASAKGFTLNTPAYTTSGAKLWSLANNGTEKASIDKDGAATFYAVSAGTVNFSLLVGTSNAGLVSTGTPRFAGSNTDNSTAVGSMVGSWNPYTTTGAKLVSFAHTLSGAAVEKAYLDKDGQFSAVGYGAPNVTPSNQGLVFSGGDVYLRNAIGAAIHIGTNAGDIILVQGGTGTLDLSLTATTKIILASTDSTGTPGAATINKASGRSAVASGAQTVVVTNSACTGAASKIFLTPRAIDTSAPLWKAIAGTGSFTVTTYSVAGVATNVSSMWPFDWLCVN